jgi:hypothetical protein
MRFLTIALLFLSFSAVAQKQANVWYFGNDGAGLDFNNCGPAVLTDGKIDGFEGVTTISDKNTGQVLFCTNSDRAWDRNGDTIPNSHFVDNGSTITQVLVIEQPGSDSLYYIITSEVQAFSGEGYRFHAVDMSLNGGLGGIAFKDSVLYPSPVTEKLTAIKHANGTDIWIVGHEYNSNKFLAFLVTSAGIDTSPVVSSIGKVVSDPSNLDPIGEIKASPDGSKLAMVTLFHPDIELYDFDNATGQLSNLITLPEPGAYNGMGSSSGLYGLSFSSSSKMLYASEWVSPPGVDGKLIQYDISSNDSATINNSRVNIFTSASKSLYSLKLAPDRKIYVAQNVVSGYLGVINDPDSPGMSCNYIDSGIYLNGKHSGWGLNNLMEYGTYCANGNPLAIKISNIEAMNRGPRNRIDWSTASETPGDQMILQRSFDGRSFKAITEIAAKGKASNYTYWDEQPTQGINYYRLQLRETSGNSTYSKVVSATVNTSGALTLSASPNPVLNQLTVNVTGAVRGTGTLTVTDPTGKTLLQVPADAGTSLIDMSSFAAGIYFIRYSDDAGTLTTRVSKL